MESVWICISSHTHLIMFSTYHLIIFSSYHLFIYVVFILSYFHLMMFLWWFILITCAVHWCPCASERSQHPEERKINWCHFSRQMQNRLSNWKVPPSSHCCSWIQKNRHWKIKELVTIRIHVNTMNTTMDGPRIVRIMITPRPRYGGWTIELALLVIPLLNLEQQHH